LFVGAGRDGVGHEVFEFPDLVAAEPQARIAVVALGKDVTRPAEMRGEALQFHDWLADSRRIFQGHGAPAADFTVINLQQAL
jgi:hypothetical protein